MKHLQVRTEKQVSIEMIYDFLYEIEEILIANSENLTEILERLNALEQPKPKRRSEVMSYVAKKRERDSNGKFIKK